MKADEYNERRLQTKLIQPEHVTELVRYWQAGHDLEVDGYCGDLTISSIEAVFPSPPPEEWPFWDGPQSQQPRNRREVYGMFGDPASGANPGQSSTHWEREHLIECHQRYGNQLPGVPAARYIKVHRIVEPYLREALRRATSSCPDYPIERFACFNFRHIRHDPNRPLSMHSWGIAVDVNPHWNKGIQFKKGQTVPKAWTEEWFKIWPMGVPKAFVQAFASCGWSWGSDWDEDGDNTDHPFQDAMHFEWIARDGVANLV